MTQKTALILSVVLTAFVLVLGGGIVARVSQPTAPAEAAPVASAPTAPAPTATIDANAQVEQLAATARSPVPPVNRRGQPALAASQSATRRSGCLLHPLHSPPDQQPWLHLLHLPRNLRSQPPRSRLNPLATSRSMPAEARP